MQAYGSMEDLRACDTATCFYSCLQRRDIRMGKESELPEVASVWHFKTPRYGLFRYTRVAWL